MHFGSYCRGVTVRKVVSLSRLRGIDDRDSGEDIRV